MDNHEHFSENESQPNQWENLAEQTKQLSEDQKQEQALESSSEHVTDANGDDVLKYFENNNRDFKSYSDERFGEGVYEREFAPGAESIEQVLRDVMDRLKGEGGEYGEVDAESIMSAMRERRFAAAQEGVALSDRVRELKILGPDARDEYRAAIAERDQHIKDVSHLDRAYEMVCSAAAPKESLPSSRDPIQNAEQLIYRMIDITTEDCHAFADGRRGGDADIAASAVARQDYILSLITRLGGTPDNLSEIGVEQILAACDEDRKGASRESMIAAQDRAEYGNTLNFFTERLGKRGREYKRLERADIEAFSKAMSLRNTWGMIYEQSVGRL